jgi:hypothetical protein
MAKTTAEIIKDQLGVATRFVDDPEVTQVGTSDVMIAKPNNRRVGLVIQNLSANEIYVRPNYAASTTTGIKLLAGGSISFNFRDDFVMPTFEWHAISNSGSTIDIYVLSVEVDVNID